MLIEFKYGGIPDETFTSKQNEPSRLWFHMKRDALPWIYWHILPKGRWFGRNMIFPPRYA
jgi:sulfide:quinone oxidoreductase